MRRALNPQPKTPKPARTSLRRALAGARGRRRAQHGARCGVMHLQFRGLGVMDSGFGVMDLGFRGYVVGV